MVREANGQLVLRTAEDQEVTIPLKDIDERAASPTSLMPEGLADPLTRGELLDLVRFLSELGKVGPYAVNQARVVRRWQTLEPSKPALDALRQTGLGAVLGDKPGHVWSSAYSAVSGTLPLDAVPKIEYRRDANPHGFVRCRLDVTTGGKARLKLNSIVGLTAWLDGTPLEIGEEMVVDLKPGMRTLLLAFDYTKRQDGLRVELDDVAGSPARVRVVGGK
jgi:hypothetical protein